MALALAACTKGENAGLEEAKQQAQAEQKEREKAAAPTVKKISAPVPAHGHVACSRLIDLEKFQTALDEKDPLTVREGKAAEAAASCGIVRGGKAMEGSAQADKIKKDGVLGVIGGDAICEITAYCWTIESQDNVKKWCKDHPMNIRRQDDDSMGSYACVQITIAGKWDLQTFRFFDDDTKCILEVRPGPSQTDNNVTRTCAKVARDSITPDRLVPGEAPPPAQPATATGSGSAAKGSGS